jgi:hypothetical protein
MSAPAGSIVAYATAPGYTAADGTGSNSPYARALASNMLLAGLSIEDVFKKVRIDVNKETNGEQTPWEETSLTIDLKLAGEAAAAPKPVVTPPVPSDGADEAGDKRVIEAAYLLAVAANTIEAYEDFIKRHPKSERAEDALNVITHPLRILLDKGGAA